MLSQRIPKRGFRTNRFNTYEPLETINLQKIAYFIQKGILNPQEKITIKHLHETGVINKIEYGVKILGRGSSVLQALSHSMNIPIHLEASNATTEAVAAI